MTDGGGAYTHGHHESVLEAHSRRTAENSAGYLVPHLAPGASVLDIGCGPGSLTRDLARLVRPGRVVGVDSAPAAVAAALAGPADGVGFRRADVLALDEPDASWDVVHAHQVLQHLTDPVAALREMRRVRTPDGVVAVRDADYAAMTWYPRSAGLDAWMALYQALSRANGAEPDAGRRLVAWARAAGFADVRASSSTWTYADEDDRRWWAGSWAERATRSAFADQALDRGLASRTDLAELAAAWRSWGADPDGWFCVVHGEVLARG